MLCLHPNRWCLHFFAPWLLDVYWYSTTIIGGNNFLSHDMPSREEMFYLRDNQTNSTTQDFLSRDIENLVSHIKENLRLSGFKTKSQRRLARPSPYSNPSRSLCECCETCALAKKSADYVKSQSSSSVTTCAHHRTFGHGAKAVDDADNPYEMLQDLLRDGGLIKEAVRRLQKGLSPKQRYYSDSDEESRTPLHLYRNLEV